MEQMHWVVMALVEDTKGHRVTVWVHTFNSHAAADLAYKFLRECGYGQVTIIKDSA